MTPDGPKGPESEAASLRNRIESAIVWARQDYDHNGNLIIPREAAAHAAWSEVVPELARLTEEVALFRERDGLTRKALQVDGDGPLQFAALIVRQARDRALAEVSRLREQLAAQPALPQVDDERVDRVARALHEQRALEFAWNVKPWKDLRPEDQRRFRRQAMAAVEAVFAGVAPQSDVVTSEASPVQHGVLVEHVWRNVYATWCPACEVGVVGSQSKAEDWKDQHEADTLRPKADFGCVRIDLVSQWKKGDEALYKAHPDDEGDECQVVAVAGDTAIVEADPFPFGNPQRWSADVSELHPLPPREPSCEEVVPEGPEDASLCGQDVVPGSDRCAGHGGRPSGSERLEPRPMETGSVLVNRAELVAGMLVGIGGEHDTVPTQQQLDRAADLIFRSARRRDSTEEGQARLLAVLFDHQCAETGCTDTAADGDVMCPQHLVPDGPQQDAAQAARSEATPKGFGRCVVCGKPGEEHESRQWCMSDQYVDGSWPSPSLRKEQDTHDYLSTACLHEQHDYCVAPVVSREGKWAVIGPSYTSEQGASKNPAQCKFCSAKCRCGCHEPSAVFSQEGKEGETDG